MYGIIEINVPSLRNLGIDSKMYSSMLVPLLMEKFRGVTFAVYEGPPN